MVAVETGVEHLELLECKVHKLVFAHFEVGGLVVVDEFSIFLEDFETILMFGIPIGFVVFALPRVETSELRVLS